VDADAHRPGVWHQDIRKYRRDLRGYLCIQAQEDAEQVSTADGADQLALGIYDRQLLHAVCVHQSCCCPQQRLGSDRDGRCRHELTGGLRLGLRAGRRMQLPSGLSLRVLLTFLLPQQVCLRYKAGHAPL
jgi:hypothetical protein